MIGRLGGDEYAIVMSSDDALVLLETAQRILEVLLEPTLVEGIELSTNASIGITIRSREDTQSVELLRRADVAMYQAKSTRAGAVLYDVLCDDFSRNKLQLAEELRKAIPEGQLVLALPAPDRRRDPAGVRPGGAGALAAPAARAAAPDRLPGRRPGARA